MTNLVVVAGADHWQVRHMKPNTRAYSVVNPHRGAEGAEGAEYRNEQLIIDN